MTLRKLPRSIKVDLRPRPGSPAAPEDGAVGGPPEQVHVFEAEDILAIQAARAARRPLLVRGEPGVGKSQLARAAGTGSAESGLPGLRCYRRHHVADAQLERRERRDELPDPGRHRRIFRLSSLR